MNAQPLLALSRALHRAHDLKQVLDCVREALRNHTRYDRVYVQLPSVDRRSMTVVGYVLPDTTFVEQQVAKVEIDHDPFMQWVLSLEEPAVIAEERVLLVDDAPHVRATVERMLVRAGYRVTTVDGGRPALRHAEPVDILLTDISMPDVDGLSLAKQLTDRWPQMRVLLMTGYAPSRLGPVHWPHITEPFTPTELLMRMHAVLKESRSA